MKTTFFLVALYMVFGFFACKRDEGKMTGKQTAQNRQYSIGRNSERN